MDGKMINGSETRTRRVWASSFSSTLTSALTSPTIGFYPQVWLEMRRSCCFQFKPRCRIEDVSSESSGVFVLTVIQCVCCCGRPPWCLHCTLVTRDEWFGPALKGGGDDGAVPVRENVLRVVVDVLPAVGAGLQRTEAEVRHAFSLLTPTALTAGR